MQRILIAFAACTALIAADGVTRLPIVNGSMSDGTTTCTGWNQHWTAGGSGPITITRDTRDFKVGPASLCIASTGVGNGNVFQFIDVAGGATFELSGWLKSEGTVKTQVFVQCFDGNSHPIDYQMLKNQFEVAQDWLPFTGRITVPAGTVRVGVGIAINGDGKAWLDELRNSADPQPKAK